MSYKITVNTEFTDMEPPGLGSCEPPVTPFLTMDQYLQPCVTCISAGRCLISLLIHWHTTCDQPHYITPAWRKKDNTHTFSRKYTPAFLHWGTPDSTPTLRWRAISNSKLTDKNVKSMALNRCWKGCLFTAWKQKAVPPCLTSAGDASKVSDRSPLCPCPVRLQKYSKYWFEGYKSILATGNFSNTDSEKNED